MGYGGNLRELIKKSGLNQLQLAEKINVSGSTITHWCNAEYPPLEGVEKICKYLDVSLSEFFQTSELDDIAEKLNIDKIWLEMGLAIQPYSDEIKSVLYKALQDAAKSLLDAFQIAAKSQKK